MIWEYHAVVIAVLLTDDLNRYGAEGWELVAVVPYPRDDGCRSFSYYFKRPRPIPKGTAAY